MESAGYALTRPGGASKRERPGVRAQHQRTPTEAGARPRTSRRQGARLKPIGRVGDREVPRQRRVNLVDRMFGDPREYGSHVGFGVEAVQFDCTDQGVERGAFAPPIGTGEQKLLVTNYPHFILFRAVF